MTERSASRRSDRESPNHLIRLRLDNARPAFPGERRGRDLHHRVYVAIISTSQGEESAVVVGRVV